MCACVSVRVSFDFCAKPFDRVRQRRKLENNDSNQPDPRAAPSQTPNHCAMQRSLLLLLLLASCRAWQLAEDLCERTEIATLLPGWCLGEGRDRCSWRGVACNKKGQLIGLNLHDVPLAIDAPPSFSAPGPFMRSLTLRNCSIGGSLPADIGRARYIALDLSHNRLVGTFDWTTLATMYKLDLSHNRLADDGVHLDVVARALTHFSLSGNAELGGDLGRLTASHWPAITRFELHGCAFRGTAPNFGMAHVYDIGNNFFDAIADTSDCLSADERAASLEAGLLHLRTCDCSGNAFTTPPPRWLLDIYEQCDYEYN